MPVAVEEPTTESVDDAPMYDAMPLVATPQRAEIVSRILRETLASDNVFMSQASCEDSCGDCDACQSRLAHISRILSAPDSLVFEVWKQRPEVALAGIIYMTDIKDGIDATGHYIFFDHSLGSDKTDLMERVIDWTFSDHGEWRALRRLTIEIPEYAFALARHAQKKLGFGGPFEYENANKTIAVEGVKRDAIRWQDEPQNLLVMGLINEEKE